MTMLAETVDAVIGICTHRDTHEVEIADPAGKPSLLAIRAVGRRGRPIDLAGVRPYLGRIVLIQVYI